MADSLENQINGRVPDSGSSGRLLALLEPSLGGQQTTFSEREEALLRMLRTIDSLVDRMESEVASGVALCGRVSAPLGGQDVAWSWFGIVLQVDSGRPVSTGYGTFPH